jgi:aspartyl-tRNA(Asn)/glutamyl-tRNA(Gln) amidotransferase subunit A
MAPTLAEDRMYRVAAALESAVPTLTPPALLDDSAPQASPEL